MPRRRANLGGGHLIFSNVWPPDDRHFAEHPEFFSLQDGKRVKGHQYCYSNTNLLNLAADGAKRLAIHDGPGIRTTFFVLPYHDYVRSKYLALGLKPFTS